MVAEAVLAGVRIGVGQPVRLMAALNVSGESFYAGSVHRDAGALRDAAQRAVAEGADIVDLGAKSTAPYRDTAIPVGEEARRMTWAVEAVAAAVSVPLSADTTSAPVAAAALAAGARIVNDVSGLHGDDAMGAVEVRADGVVLAASPGRQPIGDPIAQVRARLADSLARAALAGIAQQAIVLDPGIGFFTAGGVSAAAFNCAVLDRLRSLLDLGPPLLVGVSRKAFLGRIAGHDDPADRLAASIAAAALAVYNGAAIIRTHDVGATRDAVRIAQAIRAAHA